MARIQSERINRKNDFYRIFGLINVIRNERYQSDAEIYNEYDVNVVRPLDRTTFLYFWICQLMLVGMDNPCSSPCRASGSA